MKYYVQIVEHGTEKVIKEMGPYLYPKAEKVDSGANINLNQKYYTRIIKGHPKENKP